MIRLELLKSLHLVDEAQRLKKEKTRRNHKKNEEERVCLLFMLFECSRALCFDLLVVTEPKSVTVYAQPHSISARISSA